MKFKISSVMNCKKKLGTLMVCGVLAAAVGTVSASAAGSFSTLQVKTENGVRMYSADEGETWSRQAPYGVSETVGADGKVTITRGTAPSDAGASDEKRFMIKYENGVKLYSADGGKTWSQHAPNGYSEQGGKSTWSSGNLPKEGEGGGV